MDELQLIKNSLALAIVLIRTVAEEEGLDLDSTKLTVSVDGEARASVSAAQLLALWEIQSK